MSPESLHIHLHNGFYAVCLEFTGSTLVEDNEKRLTEMSYMMKEMLAIQKKRQRNGTANAMHARQ